MGDGLGLRNEDVMHEHVHRHGHGHKKRSEDGLDRSCVC
jgi:hypothetical protein